MYDRPQGGDPHPVVSHPGGDPHPGGVIHTFYTEGDPHPGARRSFHSGGYYRIGGNPRLETNLRVNQKEVRDW